jgi:rod shape determining protein RodA
MAMDSQQTRWYERRRQGPLMRGLHMDVPLLVGLLLLSAVGLIVLYSASGQNMDVIVRQSMRLAAGFTMLLVLARIPPQHFARWTPWMFGIGVILLVAVLLMGEIGKGAQRWLDFGVLRFQPSEMMKVVVPMMVAWYLAENPLPPSRRAVVAASLMIVVPTFLIIRQPDLGTALLVASSGIFVLLLSGISWRLVASVIGVLGTAAPVLWYFLRDYQKQRVLTFLHPENDPLGAGYHIIQSKIAIGSGGLYGKGWLNGTQAHLDFLPEHSTDFIFAVLAEEFGFIGILLLLAIYFFIVARGLYIATQAQSSFNRLVAGSLVLTFFVYVFVNIGMVTGLLPVVGLPLPLVSYGGTSLVTMMAAFGVLMSIHTHRRLLSS